ncbi:MAG: asparaginase [Gammaproteobacteria bacterium]|nr:MAG: asparaginase [Gammaproteobacteria bacterium]
MVSGVTVKKKVFVLALGGTISCTQKDNEHEFYNRPEIDIKSYLTNLPLPHDSVEILAEQFSQQISHEIYDDDLINTTKKIKMLIGNKYDGIVVAQGTNCIEEASYFTNILMRSETPIIYTGSLKPATSLGFDGIRNLFNAIILASSNQSKGRGVLLTFNDCIYTARDVIKINPSISNAFSGNEFALLGYLKGNYPYFCTTNSYKHTYLSDFDIDDLSTLPEVCVIYGHIGIQPTFIEAAIAKGVKGIISAGMGAGYQSKIINESLAKAVAKGIVVVRCSRTGQGIINRDPGVDDKYGFIAGGMLSPQKARILLSVALTKTSEQSKIQEYFFEY